MSAQGDKQGTGNVRIPTYERLARLEAWVEVVMRTLATLGLEGLLCELDRARGADYSDDYPLTITDPRTEGARV